MSQWPSILTQGQQLTAGQYIVSSSGNYSAGIFDGVFCVVAGPPEAPQGVSLILHAPCVLVTMQTDGNFCAYETNPPQEGAGWCAMTNGPVCFAVMQDDGNLCVYLGQDPGSQGAFKWGSIQNGGKTSGFDPFPPVFTSTVTIKNNMSGYIGQSVAVEWANSGESPQIHIDYQDSGTITVSNSSPLSCWMRWFNPLGGDTHDSSDNFNLGQQNVSYSIRDSMVPFEDPVWSRDS